MFFRKLTWLFRRRTREREFDEELRFHLEEAAEEHRLEGASAEQAARAARRDLGNVTLVQEDTRAAWSWNWLEQLLQDGRYALRGLRRDRAFALAAVTMLTLAIGLNVTVFAVMQTMLFRGFPLVHRNDRLVYLQESYPSGSFGISYADFEDWRSQAHTFEGMAFVGERLVALSESGGRPSDMLAFTVSTNMFGLLGVPPMLGRDFTPADEIPGAPPVAILNYRFWESRFAKRADIVGLTIQISGEPATVIGVMPERFDFPSQENLWMPMDHAPDLQQRGLTARGYIAVGRLSEGITLQQARSELEGINHRLEAEYPATNRGLAPKMMTHSQLNSGPDAPVIWSALWAGAMFVLLIACANLANLTLARTIGRWREYSTRMALGAGQGRMVRQILADSLMLAGVAGTFGWWIAKWSVHRWALATASQYQVLDYTVDSSTLIYLIAVSAVAAILFSLAPITRVLQLGVSGVLKGDARGVTRGLRSKHLAAALIAGQMALAIVMLSGAGVLARSLLNIVNAETGVRDPEHILVGHVGLPSDAYPSHAARVGYLERLEAQVKSIPGIEDGSVANNIPVPNVGSRTFEIAEKQSPAEGGDAAQFMTIGSDYFRVLGASAISGRNFNDGDRMGALSVAIVNQSFATSFWPGESALGKRLRAVDRKTPGEWRTVVGVVPNIMQGDATRGTFKPLIYVPYRQEPAARPGFFLLRTGVAPNQVAQAVRAAIQKLDADVILGDFTTLKARFAFNRDFMDPEHSELQKQAAVAPIFALIALLLAAIGLYAVIAHSVSQRVHEIGIRMAIGAAAEDIRRMVVREGMFPVAIGMVLGLAASLGVNRILQAQLVRVSPYDPLTMAGAPVLLILVALVAGYVPARWATKVDPAIALRHD